MTTAFLAIVRADPVLAATDIVLLGLVQKRSGNNWVPAVAADFESIGAVVTDGGVAVGSPITFTPATVIHDSLQTGTIWPFDPGFNFDAKLGHAYLPDGDKEYNIAVTFTLTSGETYHVRYVQPTLPLS